MACAFQSLSLCFTTPQCRKPCQTIMIKRLGCGHPPGPSGLNVFSPLVFHSRHPSLTQPRLSHVWLSMSSTSPLPSCAWGFPFISQHASLCARILINHFPSGPVHSPKMMLGHASGPSDTFMFSGNLQACPCFKTCRPVHFFPISLISAPC